MWVCPWFKNVLTISTQPRWSAIGMSSKRWLAACTGVQARVSAQKSPDFAPTLRDSVFADARSGAVCGVASPAAQILAIARLLLRYRARGAAPLHPLPQSRCRGTRRLSTRSTPKTAWAFITAVMKARCAVPVPCALPALPCAMQAFFHPCNLVDAALRKF